MADTLDARNLNELEKALAAALADRDASVGFLAKTIRELALSAAWGVIATAAALETAAPKKAGERRASLEQAVITETAARGAPLRQREVAQTVREQPVEATPASELLLAKAFRAFQLDDAYRLPSLDKDVRKAFGLARDEATAKANAEHNLTISRMQANCDDLLAAAARQADIDEAAAAHQARVDALREAKDVLWAAFKEHAAGSTPQHVLREAHDKILSILIRLEREQSAGEKSEPTKCKECGDSSGRHAYVFDEKTRTWRDCSRTCEFGTVGCKLRGNVDHWCAGRDGSSVSTRSVRSADEMVGGDAIGTEATNIRRIKSGALRAAAYEFGGDESVRMWLHHRANELERADRLEREQAKTEKEDTVTGYVDGVGVVTLPASAVAPSPATSELFPTGPHVNFSASTADAATSEAVGGVPERIRAVLDDDGFVIETRADPPEAGETMWIRIDVHERKVAEASPAVYREARDVLAGQAQAGETMAGTALRVVAERDAAMSERDRLRDAVHNQARRVGTAEARVADAERELAEVKARLAIARDYVTVAEGTVEHVLEAIERASRER